MCTVNSSRAVTQSNAATDNTIAPTILINKGFETGNWEPIKFLVHWQSKHYAGPTGIKCSELQQRTQEEAAA